MCILAYASAVMCVPYHRKRFYNNIKDSAEEKTHGGRIMKNNTGENIKALRKFYGETQEELAEKMNVSSAAISYFENDKRSPDLDMTNNLALHFGISMDQLVSGELPLFRHESGFPDMDVDVNAMFSYSFPFTDAQTDNEHFKNGYRAACKIRNNIKSKEPFMDSMIDYTIEQFEAAIRETDMPEAKVNFLLTMLFKWDAMLSKEKRNWTKAHLSTDAVKVDKEFMKDFFLGRDVSINEEEAKRKEKFFEDNSATINELVSDLKSDEKWSDFADYYQAMRYISDMVDLSGNSTQHNISIGMEMMINLVFTGNKYAVNMAEKPVEKMMKNQTK